MLCCLTHRKHHMGFQGGGETRWMCVRCGKKWTNMTIFRAIKNGMTPALRALFIFLAIFAGALLLAAFLSGCQGYQPPGQDLWLALPRK